MHAIVTSETLLPVISLLFILFYFALPVQVTRGRSVTASTMFSLSHVVKSVHHIAAHALLYISSKHSLFDTYCDIRVNINEFGVRPRTYKAHLMTVLKNGSYLCNILTEKSCKMLKRTLIDMSLTSTANENHTWQFQFHTNTLLIHNK